MSIYTDGTYALMNQGWHSNDASWKSQKIIELLHSNNLKFQTYADIGCGTGDIIKNISEIFTNANYFGLDVSPGLQNEWLVKSKDKNNIIFKQINNDEKLCIKADVVSLIDVIEHVENLEYLLSQIRVNCKYIILHVPLDLSCINLIRKNKIQDITFSLGHIRYYNREIIENYLKFQKFEILDSYYTDAFKYNLKKISFFQIIFKNLRRLFSKLSPDISANIFGGQTLLILLKGDIK
jgi:SAM-dependent methyltransferase